jgi:cytidine deaminase
VNPAGARIDPDEHAARLELGETLDDIMRDLLPWALAYADPPISGFRVGAIACGESGALYAGANLEFPGMPLSASVHAEQAAVVNAWMHGESEIQAIAATATPCGHCRQFLVELGDPQRLAIYLDQHRSFTLADLLPHSFGPRDLGVAQPGMLGAWEPALEARIDGDDELGLAALGAARASYAPYSRAFAGVALQTADGTTVTGRYAESAAYNPSLPALQAALVQLALRGTDRSKVEAAVLVETNAESSQHSAAKELLGSFCSASLRYVGTGLT